MPIKAVKQKPIANMDFMRTYETSTHEIKNGHQNFDFYSKFQNTVYTL